MDITFQIIANQSSHSLESSQETGRWKQGQIVDCFESSGNATFDGTNYIYNDVINSKFLMVHVKDVPIVSFVKFYEKITQAHNNILGMQAKRKYKVDKSSIPNNVKNKLVADREITLNWAAVKPYVMNNETKTSVIDAEVI